MAARPTKPKDLKPKALEPTSDSGGGGNGGTSVVMMIIMAVIITLCTTAATATAFYFLAPMIIKPMLAELSKPENGEGGHSESPEQGAHHPQVGPVVDLEEFTVNLKDPGGERYLRADISISVTTDDPEFEKLSGEALHKWEEEFNLEMGHYVPAIRDIVISNLTKRTSTELSTTMGKESLKLEIKRNVDALFSGHRKVIRVNLENFIIQ